MAETPFRVRADATPSPDPARGLTQPWPDLLIAALVLAGLVSPLITLFGAAGASQSPTRIRASSWPAPA